MEERQLNNRLRGAAQPKADVTTEDAILPRPVSRLNKRKLIVYLCIPLLLMLSGYVAVSWILTPPHSIKLVAHLPLQEHNPQTQNGKPILAGIQQAVDEANRLYNPFWHNYKYQVVQDDYVWQDGKRDPEQSSRQLNALINRDSAVAVVLGPYNSDVAEQTVQMVNAKQIPMISPSVTYECLTQQDGCDVNRNSQGAFFRIASLNAKQASTLATCWHDSHCIGKGYATALVIHDDDPYSNGLANYFAHDWQVRDKLLANITVANPPSEAAYGTLLKNISETCGLVFFAGDAANGLNLYTALQAVQKDQIHGKYFKAVTFAAGSTIMSNVFNHNSDLLTHSQIPMYTIAPHKSIANDNKLGKDLIGTFQNSPGYSKHEYGYTTHVPAGYFVAQVAIESIERTIARTGSLPSASTIADFREKLIENIANFNFSSYDNWSFPVKSFLKPSPEGKLFKPSGDVFDDAASVYMWEPDNRQSPTYPWAVLYL